MDNVSKSLAIDAAKVCPLLHSKILGGIDSDEICMMFEGKEKLICKSLFSWVNAGSHHALDDLYVSIDDATVDTYLGIFRAIFKKSGHLAHYEMMLGESAEV